MPLNLMNIFHVVYGASFIVKFFLLMLPKRQTLLTLQLILLIVLTIRHLVPYYTKIISLHKISHYSMTRFIARPPFAGIVAAIDRFPVAPLAEWPTSLRGDPH